MLGSSYLFRGLLLQGLVCFVFEECHETPSQIALLRMTESGVGKSLRRILGTVLNGVTREISL